MIEKVIQQIATELHPSSGDNLTGFIIDTDHFLEKSGKFKSVKVSRTKDRLCLVNAHVEISYEIPTIQDLSQLLYDAWNNIRYSHFAASACHWYKEATIFRFVTIISKHNFFVTGKIIATGEPYSKLAKDFEQNFGKLPSINQ